MARSRRTAHTRIAPDSVIADIRSVLPRLIARIASAIQHEVPAYAGPVLGGRRALIENALTAGVREFMDRLSGKARSTAEVDELFRRFGRDEATDGQTLEAMRTAHDIATREIWDEIHRLAITHRLPASVLGRLGDALFEQVGHFRDQVEVGHRAGLDAVDADRHLSRERLARRLIDGAEESELEKLAPKAHWLLPDQVIIACGRPPEEAPPIDPDSLGVDALILVDAPYVLMLCDARKRDDTVSEARKVLGDGLITVSFSMAPNQVSTAARLAKRAHQLVGARVIHNIPDSKVVECTDHEETLWLHSEPILRERLAERLLRPLANETPHRRRMLALTLLIWLERRASAPVIARELGVHPQTVRHRLRQLDTMFDDRLNDPSLAFPMLLALKATLPSWLTSRAEDDQS